jgi:16S rRNA (uracil1498-N3)-methyltransferase
MAWPRFFVDRLPESGCFTLDENESRHASSVLRMAIGDSCLAFDGCGGEARCAVVQLQKRSVELEVLERLDSDRELPTAVHLSVALPKGDRQKTLIDFLVPLGVHALQPLVTKRGVAQPVDAALARLRRSVIETSKQCGRNRLMNILEPVGVAQMTTASPPDNRLQLFAHPYGEVTSLTTLQPQIVAAVEIAVLIGPEGGFNEDEASALRQGGWTAVSLGPRILRVEVAATFVASWLAETTGH